MLKVWVIVMDFVKYSTKKKKNSRSNSSLPLLAEGQQQTTHICYYNLNMQEFVVAQLFNKLLYITWKRVLGVDNNDYRCHWLSYKSQNMAASLCTANGKFALLKQSMLSVL